MRTFLKVLLGIILIGIYEYCDGQNKRFFDFNEGLSNSLINKICQDDLGFIWVATEDGLNLFDGIQFKTFTQEEHGLNANYITTLKLDSKGNIWVGLVNGLQKYNYETNTFEEIKIYVNNEQVHPFISEIVDTNNGDIWLATTGLGLIHISKDIGRPRYSTRLNEYFSSLYIRTLFEDSDGLLWLGTDNHGINTYNPNNDKVEKFSSNDRDNPLLSNDITSFCEDKNGDIYVGSIKGGLCKIEKISRRVIPIQPQTNEEAALPVKTLFIDSKHRLWIGTDGTGLWLYNILTEQLEMQAPPSSSFNFSNSKVHTIMEDKAGNIWAGIFQKGLFLFPETKGIFNHYGYQAFGNNSIGSSCVTAISGEDNAIWIGTDGDGLYKYDKITNRVQHLYLQQKSSTHRSTSIFAINNSFKNELWIGTYSNGLFKYDKDKNQTMRFRNNPNDSSSIPSDIITSINTGNDSTLWLSTFGAGIVSFNRFSETFTQGIPLNDSLNSMIPLWVNDVYINDDGNFWIATYEGLVYANLIEETISIYTNENSPLPSRLVYCIKPDNWGNLWIGTFEGLVKITPSTMRFKTYTDKDGLASNVICAIEEDEYYQLWISTHKGLSKLNPIENSFVNFYASDGLQSNEFFRNSVFKTNDNQILFGGINGITEIRKDYNNFARVAPEVMLTKFSCFNNEVKIGDKSGKHTILNRSIVLADTVFIEEKDNVFSIEFTSVDLANQSRITYEYLMDGFDNVWNQNNAGKREATYTNLPHGTYTFKVRGVDKKQYSKPRNLTIIIRPPWYKTVWAKVLWFLLSVTVVYIIVQMYKEKFKRIESERLNEKKMQFFINISHEIRTPLSLIIDPLDKLLSQKTDAETTRLHDIMQQNANRIFRLINQLLDVRKIDKGQMLFKYQKTNVYDFVNQIADSYYYLASSKKIEFNVKAEDKDLFAWIDPLNFEKVIINLLSNAFKFTPQLGSVNVVIKKENNSIKILVSDTGIGIKKIDIERIFDRFYQVDSKETRNTAGTGIGLNLSRSIIKIHKGKLYALNNSDTNGSTFVIELPIGHAHLPAEELVTDENILPTPIQTVRPENNRLNPKYKTRTNTHIMVVEDELEIRDYLESELSAHYKVSTFENGELAHANLHSVMPDLIISDIMMPIMDGISLCKKIKRNVETSHIPVILLTALSKEEDKAEGIETGADMYLVKPFNTKFLISSINNLLDNRRKVEAKVEKRAEKYALEPAEIKSHDEILMQKVMTIIKENISNNKLNVEMLADGVGISRVHMHRKLKEITNQSPRDLIKNIRMKQASYILVNKDLNISEIAYSLGYSSLSHFSTSFKSHYGVSPKEYVENQKSNN